MGAANVQVVLGGVDGVKKVATACRGASKLDVTVTCVRGAATPCTYLVRNVTAAPAKVCTNQSMICDAYIGGTRSLVSTGCLAWGCATTATLHNPKCAADAADGWAETCIAQP